MIKFGLKSQNVVLEKSTIDSKKMRLFFDFKTLFVFFHSASYKKKL